MLEDGVVDENRGSRRFGREDVQQERLGDRLEDGLSGVKSSGNRVNTAMSSAVTDTRPSDSTSSSRSSSPRPFLSRPTGSIRMRSQEKESRTDVSKQY